MQVLLSIVLAAGMSHAHHARAAAHAGGAPSANAITLSAVRSWSSPTGTRVVLDFSAPVSAVAPDSGVSRELRVTVPGTLLRRGAGVPEVLGVRDGLVDSVLVATGDGAFHVWFHDATKFRVFQLPPEPDKPFRIVVDAERPGGEQEEAQRIAGVAAAKTPPVKTPAGGARADRVRIIAVDPGHGGEDSGAHGRGGVLEKNTNLGVARALVDALNRMPGLRAALTRDGDYFIPLRERYHIAERMKADLFISIHANSSPRPGSSRGTEVYFLSLRGASDQASRDLAGAENAADLVGGVPPQAEDDLVGILYDVKRSSALQQSQLLAETLLDHVTTDRRLEGRGIKQAGFVVLKSVEFPSVLVETAFINNAAEARLLANPQFQLQMGQELAEGVRSYFEKSGMGLMGTSGTSGTDQGH
jgi:N-acetylmuramoyl-L-alanine amidase